MSGLDPDYVARLLELAERANITELDLTLGDTRLRVVRSETGAPATLSVAAPTVADPPLASPVTTPPASAHAALHAIRAGFPGTFYRAPAPGEAPFVAEGRRVEDGTQLAILEAMKTMNPVESDAAGTVVRVAVADGAAVEAGDLLFEIERAP